MYEKMIFSGEAVALAERRRTEDNPVCRLRGTQDCPRCCGKKHDGAICLLQRSLHRLLTSRASLREGESGLFFLSLLWFIMSCDMQ